MRCLAAILLLLASCVHNAPLPDPKQPAIQPAVVSDQTIVCFTWSKCGPCRQFHNDLDADPSLSGGRNVTFVDVQEQPAEARRYKVRNTPTFIVLEDGRELGRTIGYSGPGHFRQWLEQYQ